jgi:hypothetical protein
MGAESLDRIAKTNPLWGELTGIDSTVDPRKPITSARMRPEAIDESRSTRRPKQLGPAGFDGLAYGFKDLPAPAPGLAAPSRRW